MSLWLRLAVWGALSAVAYWVVDAETGEQSAVALAPEGAGVRGSPAGVPHRDPPVLAAGVSAAPVSAAPAAPRRAEPHPTLHEPWLVAHGFLPGPARQRLMGLLDGRTESETAPRHTLAMRPSSHAVPDAGAQRASWSVHERYAHASLAPGLAGGEDAVLLRWRRLDDGTVMELSAHPVDAHSSGPLDVWMFRGQDWAAGRYRLEVISANPRLELLAAGEFDIVPDGVPITAFAYPVASSTAH